MISKEGPLSGFKAPKENDVFIFSSIEMESGDLAMEMYSMMLIQILIFLFI